LNRIARKIMLQKLSIVLSWFFLCIAPAAFSQPGQAKTGLKFSVSFDRLVHPSDITGRVYVMISRNNNREPRFQVSESGVPFWGMNVSRLKPGSGAIISDTVFGYPLESIGAIPAGEYYVQGFVNVYTEFRRSDGHTLWMHNDQWEGQDWRRGEGNLYSEVKKVYIDPAKVETIELVCKKANPAVKIPDETKMVKRIRIRSRLLSDFWGQPMYLGATVLLPKGYDENPGELYPVNYQHGHFSLGVPFGFRDPAGPATGSGRQDSGFSGYWMSDSCPRMIAITILHPCPYYDDSYAVNSPNLGPYDDAIQQELIPYLETRFRIIRQPYARILSGGSTGGWIALDQQIRHPAFYGGAFSSCADPVDFHYHQIVNIYEDQNAYYLNNEWTRVDRPDTRRTDGNVRSTMSSENLFELVQGDRSRSGGQWDIWEAAFSPIGPDGYPMRIWDKRTGAIDHAVAEQWKKYDLHVYLKENWSSIGNDLRGKLFIYMGDMDTYYLNNAMELLSKFLKGTKEPYFDGLIDFGRKMPHGYGPRGIELVTLMAKQVEKNRKK